MTADPTRRCSRPAAVVVGALTLAVAAGCGSVREDATAASAATESVGTQASTATLDSRALVTSAVENLRARPVFHVRGSTTDGALDLVFVKDVGAMGTVTAGGAPITVLATAGKVWVKGDAAWYESTVGAGSAALIGEKWVELPTSALPQVAVLTNGTALLGGLLDPTADVTLTAVRDLEGQKVVGAQDPVSGGTLWVAATGTPLPVRFDERGAVGDRGVLRFVEDGTEVTIAAPPPEQVAVVPAASAPPAPGPTAAPPG